MKILIVEDEKPKLDQLREFIFENFSDSVFEFCFSVRSAIDAVKTSVPDLMILDMSLPTFDIGSAEGGGRPRGFGGLEILYELDAEGITCPVIVVTGYDAFSSSGKDLNLEDLAHRIQQDHTENFRCLIHYNSLFGEWQTRLLQALHEVRRTRQ